MYIFFNHRQYLWSDSIFLLMKTVEKLRNVIRLQKYERQMLPRPQVNLAISEILCLIDVEISEHRD